MLNNNTTHSNSNTSQGETHITYMETNTHESSIPKICILGASGFTGKVVVEILLGYSNFQLTLVGRSVSKLEQVTEELLRKHNHKIRDDINKQNVRDRISLKELDVERCLTGYHDKLEEALKNHTVLINTIPPFREKEKTLALGRMMIKLGIDYIDPHMNPATLSIFKELHSEAVKSNTTIISQSGMYPGLEALLTRHTQKYIPHLTHANVVIMTREEGGLGITSGVADVADFMKVTGSKIMKDGKWQEDNSFSKKFHLVTVDTTLNCYPLELEEMKQLNIPTLKNMGVYVSEMGLFADSVMLALQLSTKYLSCLADPLTNLLAYATSKIREPFGSAVQVETTDCVSGEKITLSLYHEKTYYLTAVSMIAVVEQLIESRNGVRNPGVHYASIYADPTLFIESCKNKGVRYDHVSK
ncbi:hypothetical protein FDP41_013315 [Naegleria fowleri]|uniref:Saccharopine dehydrogenase NADP binding domain-containing protein n=1 Tax=Naegleria fowleri TaxID=5763 RepID=A0A6A5C244_NAEFO|nr:uncharacterized protein FDP41_013315 [Naegleria fowleri]KAF0980832.1 hypothetical protein FDP41_013315 [Naegleria fowleri]CAG4718817.1 unnamed protein product [Naegleria fowleri]